MARGVARGGAAPPSAETIAERDVTVVRGRDGGGVTDAAAIRGPVSAPPYGNLGPTLHCCSAPRVNSLGIHLNAINYMAAFTGAADRDALRRAGSPRGGLRTLGGRIPLAGRSRAAPSRLARRRAHFRYKTIFKKTHITEPPHHDVSSADELAQTDGLAALPAAPRVAGPISGRHTRRQPPARPRVFWRG